MKWTRTTVIGVTVFCVLVAGIGFVSLRKGKRPVGFFKNSHAEEVLQRASRLTAEGNKEEAILLLQQFLSETPVSPVSDEALLSLGDLQREEGKLLEAKTSYRKIVESFPDSNSAPQAQERLGKINLDILFSPILTESDKTYVVQPGDNLAKIAARQGTTVELMKQANRLTSHVILPGKKLKIPGGKFSILVDKSQNTLTLKLAEEVLKVYTVATGSEKTPTPVGTFTVINKLVNPVWYTVGAVVPADSPQNILGSRWIGISEAGYGIHGTRDPSSIGKSVTAGCVRMLNENVEELYNIVPIGTEVTIID